MPGRSSYPVLSDKVKVAHLLGLPGDAKDDRGGSRGRAAVIQQQPAARIERDNPRHEQGTTHVTNKGATNSTLLTVGVFVCS